ncbi:MAG: Type 1 glutamine amidotransferase-like domain-containing protein [Chlorobi bacterium]|nr:Type 1 glutamine amidotransferase-like domain-containing protein [Chlorobiota bacterium]MCI0716286.1 Type 1 glutamine amidotransferase-like domain-containing protein [Chlorobiota bacterium]
MLKSLSKITRKVTTKLNNTSNNGQIIALGGGGFSDPGDNLLLDEYILLQTNKSKPKVLFLPTAGGDHEDYIGKFYRAYKKFNCKPVHLSLSKKLVPYKKLEQLVLSQDMIFTGGGSPRFLMQVWRKSGLDKIIKKAWKQGIVLAGMSAGAICWYEDGFKNPKDDIWRRISCLGFLEGSFCPHYDKRGELRKAYRKMISSGEISPGYGVEDGVALHYIGTELKYVVSSVTSAKAFYMRKSGFRVTEKEISPTYLGILNEAKVNEAKGNEAKVNEAREEKSEKESHTNDSINIVKEYIKKINEHDVEAIVNMMSEDHTFIDSLGINTNGRENMRAAWDTYLTFFPDYTVQIRDIISKNGMVAVFGTAKGTLATGGRLLDENKFEIPASWTAVVKDGKIAKWRVYADNEPVRKLIEKYSKS